MGLWFLGQKVLPSLEEKTKPGDLKFCFQALGPWVTLLQTHCVITQMQAEGHCRVLP